jgi:O-antigen ligase
LISIWGSKIIIKKPITVDLISSWSLILVAFFLPISTTLTDVLLMVGAFSLFFSHDLKAKIMILIHNPIALFLLAFFVLFLLGIFYSSAPWNDVFLMLKKYHKLLLAALIMPFFYQEILAKRALYVFLLAMFLLLIISYLKYWGVFHLESHLGAVEVFKQHIEFNFLMSFAVYFFALEVSEWPKKSFLFFVGLILIAVACYNILFLSEGRSGYFIFLGLFALFFLQKLKGKGVILAVLSVAILAASAFFLSPTFSKRINLMVVEAKNYSPEVKTSVGLRISFAKNSWELIKKHPLIGTGTGSFITEYAQLTPTPIVKTHNPHNEYLHLGVQFGSLGILFLLGLFGASFWYARYLPEKQKLMVQALTIAMIIGCLGNSWLMDTTEGHFYLYFLALCFGCFRSPSLRCPELAVR